MCLPVPTIPYVLLEQSWYLWWPRCILGMIMSIVTCEQSFFDLPRSVEKRKRLCKRLRYSLTCRSSEKRDESVKFWTRQTSFTLLPMINSSNCWLIPRLRYFVFEEDKHGDRDRTAFVQSVWKSLEFCQGILLSQAKNISISLRLKQHSDELS